jgi:LacI family transcriptional regulator
LTTVRQPVAEMAETAIRLLTEAPAGGREAEAEKPREHLIAHSLIIRESSGPPGE